MNQVEPRKPYGRLPNWEFKRRFRRQAFGCEPEPAIAAIGDAVVEIERNHARRAAEGAVGFLVRVSPALELVDAASGAIGAAVNDAIARLSPIIGVAFVDGKTRERWLERLFAAHGADRVPYLGQLADRWGELCGSKVIASVWAERLLPYTRLALSPDPELRGHFHGTVPCLSALFRAERWDELVELLEVDTYWPYKRWAVNAMVACGKKAEALRLAESCRTSVSSPRPIDEACEAILLSSGLYEQAYDRYAARANRRDSLLATASAIAAKYPHKAASEVLRDLTVADLTR